MDWAEHSNYVKVRTASHTSSPCARRRSLDVPDGHIADARVAVGGVGGDRARGGLG